MKKALVLAGGGAKGAYEVGFIKALEELNIHFDIITGTSIGALNGCLYIQSGLQGLESLWKQLDYDKIFKELPDITFTTDDFMNQSNLVLSFFKKYLKNKGADVTPFYNLIKDLYNKDKFINSSIDFGLCTVLYPSLKPVFLTKEDIKNNVCDYLFATSACFPIFPMMTIEDKTYLDGGYYDNLPIDLAITMGADEIVVVDMHQEPIHTHYVSRPHITYTNPYTSLGNLMDFNQESISRNMNIGYLTCMKYYHKYSGFAYTFVNEDHAIFEKFYKHLLNIEIEERNRLHTKESHYMNDLLEKNRNIPLQIKDYTYHVLDDLGTLYDKDILQIYTIDEFMKDIIEDINDKMNHLSVTDITSSSRKTFIAYTLKQILDHNTFIDLKYYPNFMSDELLIAYFLSVYYDIMK